MKLRNFYFILLGGGLLMACSLPKPWPQLSIESVTTPTSTNCVFPTLSSNQDAIWMGWLDESKDSLNQYKVAAFDGQQWSSPELAAAGRDWFVNWADYPSITVGPKQNIYVHTLEKSGVDVYAYDIKVRNRSHIGAWSTAIKPYQDTSATEHGFPSFVPLSGERLAAIWLDGRNYIKGGSEEMMLAYTTIEGGQASQKVQFLDRRICDCCQTDMAMSSQGLVAVYRDRSPQEVRDIYIVRQIGETWTEPKPIHNDQWKISGCPVNGPAITAKGDTLAVAWFTSAGGEARVLASMSFDAGETFGNPVLIDAGQALGRVDIEFDNQNQAWVSWLRKEADTGQIRICTFRADGSKSEAIKVSEINPRRKSGFPQLHYWQKHLWLAWTETEPQNQIQFVKISIDG
ncbi:MAG: sialidase family protein [Bacteroidia bacterium]